MTTEGKTLREVFEEEAAAHARPNECHAADDQRPGPEPIAGENIEAGDVVYFGKDGRIYPDHADRCCKSSAPLPTLAEQARIDRDCRKW